MGDIRRKKEDKWAISGEKRNKCAISGEKKDDKWAISGEKRRISGQYQEKKGG